MTLLAPPATAPLDELDRSAIAAYLDGAIDTEAFVAMVPPPPWGPIGEEVYRRTYARKTIDPETGEVISVEEWADTCRRVVLGNLGFAPADAAQPDEALELFELVYRHRLLPAGRHLWVTGTAVSKLSRNCWVSGWELRLSTHFRFLAARLFEGGGVGANYSLDLREVTAPLDGTVEVTYTCRADHPDFDAVTAVAPESWVVENPAVAAARGVRVIEVADTREGWVDAYCAVIDAATQVGHHQLMFVVSGIRPHGAELKTFGGHASGPAPLVKALVGIAEVVNRADASGRLIGALESMEIDHLIAESVVAGGARRSARLAALHWTDPEILDFISCKADGRSHWSANISVEIDGAFRVAVAHSDQLALQVLAAVAVGMATNGEPGLIDTELMSLDEPRAIRITNPCGEATLSTDGAEGESCNLGSVNLDAYGTDFAGAQRGFELMARFLYRATMNHHPDPSVGRIEERNRRLGVGFMGMQGWCAAHGVRLTDFAGDEALRTAMISFRLAARDAADDLADSMGLPRPVKVTAVAPVGTISQIPGTQPGLHPVKARYFIRRVRFAVAEQGWRDAEAQGYRVVDDVYAANTKVVEFIVKDSVLDRFPEALIEQSNEVTASQFFELVCAVQETFCGPGDGQAVSATGQIPVGTDPIQLAADIAPWLGRLKGVTVFPDRSFDLPPYEPLERHEYEARIAELEAGAELAAGDSNDGSCSTGACPIR